jgi:hypothetical protein
MIKKRSKKRNILTTNKEITELAYVLHLSAGRMRTTITSVNIPAAYREQISRKVQWLIEQAQSLGDELDPAAPTAFVTKESTERIAEHLGLFN